MPTDTITVDPTNREQLRAWDGDEGAYWAAHPDHFERALDHYDEAFFAAAAISAGDRVLDVGCGTGKTARQAARAASKGSVLGVDLSSAMLEVARLRAADEDIDNIRFAQIDAQVHAFEPGSFDVALGRTSAMFFGDRVAGLTNVGRALRSGGRLVLLTWQPFGLQEWLREFSAALAVAREIPPPPEDTPNPFTLSDRGVVGDVLAAAGYTDVTMDDRREPMWFGADAEDAYGVVLGLLRWMLEGLDDADRARAQDALRATIAAHETPEGVVYDSAAWLIRATRP